MITAPRRFVSLGLLLALLLGLLSAQVSPSGASHGINISVDDAEVDEGDGDELTPNDLVFKISATIPDFSTTVVQVDYATADFTAMVSDDDYTPESGTAVLTAANPTFEVRVDVTGDTKLERDEILLLGLTNAMNGHIIDGAGEGKIINDDGPSVSIDDVDEDNGVPEGQGPLNFTVRLSEAVDFDVEVDFETADGTATAPDDYVHTTGTVTIPAGDTSATGAVELVDDEVNEWTDEDGNVEQFEVGLDNARAVDSDAVVTISDETGVMTILDDDADAVIEVKDVAVAETDNTDLIEPTTVVVTVEIVEGETDEAITFDYATEDGTAAGSDFPQSDDYQNTDGSGSIPAGGVGAKTEIEIPITGDETPEAFETFILRISNVSDNATATKPVGTITIQNDDAIPAAGDVTVEEGDDAVFVVSIDHPSIEDVTVDYATSDGSAVAGEDYVTTSGSVTIPSGETRRTVTVETLDDDIDESGDASSTGQQFNLDLTAVANANNPPCDGLTCPSLPSGVATLLDNDDPPVLSVVSEGFVEGNAGEREVDVTISLSGNQTQRAVTFDWSYGASGDTASGGGNDYDDGSDSGQISVGARQTTIPLTIKGDTTPEPDETLTVVLSNVANAAAGSIGTVTIENDDETVAIEDASFETEGDAGTTTTTVTVRIGEAQDHAITFDWTTQDSGASNAATADVDYTSDSGEVTILAGQTTAEITVEAIGDTIDESDEVFEVVISNPSDPNVIVIDDTAVVTIPDDDGVSLRIADAEVLEGDSGTTTMEFTVTLSGGTAAGDISFDYETADGTATATVILLDPDDYEEASGTATITEGNTSTTIEVTVNGDTDPEDYQTFTVTISNPTGGATIDDAEAIGTILNDDTALSIADANANEGDGSMLFTVTASHISELDASAEVDTANGTATAGDDYVAIVDGNVTVPAGQTSVQFAVTLIDDTIDESDTETFTVTLSNPTNAALGDPATATGTINDNDAPPSISAGDASVTEGDEDTTDVNVKLTLSSASEREITIEFATSDGTATAGEDYAANSGSATFAPGVTEVTVTLAVAGDVEDEGDEHFFLNLSNPTNATIGDGTGKITILDDDATPALSISDATVAEDAVDGEVTLSVTLSQAAKQTVTVDYASQNGTATSGEDYEAVSGLLTFAVGDTVKTITVPINDDSDLEGDETFDIVLSNPTNATIADGTGVVTIEDDETPPNSKPTVDAGTNRAVETATSQSYSATASDPDGDTLTYSWNFGDGSAPQTGNPVSHTFDDVGAYTVTVTVSDGNGGTASDMLLVNAFDTGVVGRSWGTDRILTAVAASQAHWPSAGHSQASAHTGPAATEALIAYAYKYPDALAAGPLSAKLDAPLLLSDTQSLPAIVEEELERLGVSTVWLLGGPASLSPAIEQRLEDLGYEVERRSGDSRFDTAADIATEVGRNSTGEVVVTLGEHADQNRAFPDALSAGSLSASPQQMPLLLTRTDDVPLVTEHALAELDTRKVWIVGGFASVSANVEARLRTLGYQVERLDGPGRYETSVAVAQEALSRAADGPVRLVFVTGEKFPDGLAGGAIAGRVDGLLVLVPNGELPAATRQFLGDNADRFDVGVILGGENTLSEAVKAALTDLIDI